MRSRYSLEGGLRVGGVGIPVPGADGASSPAIPSKRAGMEVVGRRCVDLPNDVTAADRCGGGDASSGTIFFA